MNIPQVSMPSQNASHAAILYVELSTVVKVKNAVPWIEASRSFGPVPEPVKTVS